MEIKEAGELGTFETMPAEAVLYMTAIRYTDGLWLAGPSGDTKAGVVKALQTWSGIDAARIYKVTLPAAPLPAA